MEARAARGNTSLESAVQLTKDLRGDIQAISRRIVKAANEEELLRNRSTKAKSREQADLELILIVNDMKKLLIRIEDAVPLINLAITTSGVKLSTTLPAMVSPSRLLQASTLLTAADVQYMNGLPTRVQIGPIYTLSMYMLFAGHANRPRDDDEIRATTWKEVIHKARVKLVRLPLTQLYHLPGETKDSNEYEASIPAEDTSAEFAYQLVFIEDFDDDRVHSFDESEAQPGDFDGVHNAGIRDIIPIHQISKIFYADTGKILNIGSDGETNSPVLLLKRDIHAEPPRSMIEQRLLDDFEDENGTTDVHPSNDNPQLGSHIAVHPPRPWSLPADLDPEWCAFEVYTEAEDSDDEGEVEDSSVSNSTSGSKSNSRHQRQSPANLNQEIKRLTIQDQVSENVVHEQRTVPIKTSLSLLEMLIRLTALQQFQQASHLTIDDEMLHFFLEDSATTGAGPNVDARYRTRRDARKRLGFDPYDESPQHRHGEDYADHGYASLSSEGQQTGHDYDRGYSPNVRASVESPTPFMRTRDGFSPSVRQQYPLSTSVRSSPIPSTPSYPRNTSGSDNKSRYAVLRSQSEKPKSPLASDRLCDHSDSGLGTSPASNKLQNPK